MQFFLNAKTFLEPVEFKTFKTDFVANETEDMTIRCDVDGNPKPVIHWSFENKPIDMSGEQLFFFLFLFNEVIFLADHHYIKIHDGLKIVNIKRNDTGDYVCKAFQNTSEFIDVQDRTIHLSVQCKTTSLFLSRDKLLTVLFNSCHINS